MSPAADRAALVACLALLGVGFLALSAAAVREMAPSTLAAGLALCFVPYVGVLLFSRAMANARAVRTVAWLGALLLGGLLLWAPPAFSDDLYRYLWEGRLWVEGVNPYRQPPDAISLEPLRDELWSPINNKPLASIYPPLLQLIFAAAAWLGGGAWTIKLLALTAHVSGVAIFGRLVRDPRAALALGLNPLLLSESALNGHFDVLVGTALLIAAWALGRHRYARAVAGICGAVGIKVVGVVALPLLWPKKKAFLSAASVSALMLAPLLWFRGLDDPASGTAQFATRWRGNESFFALFDWIARLVVSPESAELVARVGAGLVVVVVVVVVVRRRLPPLTAVRVAMWSVLLLSPQVHPWYLAWLLPLELAAGASAGAVWSVAVLCAYAPLDRWLAEGVWEMPLGARVGEYLLVLVALLADPRRPSLSRMDSNEVFFRDFK